MVKETFKIFFAFICLCLFSACGLDEYIVIDAPYSIHAPEVTSYSTYSEYAESYFKLKTIDTGTVSSNLKFVGTKIYYKIYKYQSTMASHNSSISSTVSSTNAANSATQLIETYGYKELYCGASPFNTKGDEELIYIRLSNYQSELSYSARIMNPDSDNVAVTTYGIPKRYGGNLTFDFGRSSQDEEHNKIPQQDDEDVNFSGSSTDDDNQWYVSLYAVSVGRDVSFANTYSTVTYLGSVCIKDNTEDN